MCSFCDLSDDCKRDGTSENDSKVLIVHHSVGLYSLHLIVSNAWGAGSRRVACIASRSTPYTSPKSKVPSDEFTALVSNDHW